MHSSKIIFAKLGRIFWVISFIAITLIAVPILGVAYSEGMTILGLKTVTVEVVGTGSMYPSLFWDKSEGGPEDSKNVGIAEYRSSPLMYRRFVGFKFGGKTYFRREINYGDMVAFKNSATQKILETEGKSGEAGFIKRVIALPGDTIELRDGYVLKNNQLIAEPYIYLPRSTYGGSTLSDCTKLTVPSGMYFVLGDNRKVSSDSRYELGLIRDEDILYDLPYGEQKIYQSLWRDTANDSKLMGQPTLDKNKFYELLNKVRAASGVKTLAPSSALAKSAGLRGDHLLLNKNTPYTLATAMSAAGYHNILTGEFVSYGHFTEAELLQNLLAFGDTAKQIKNNNYQDIGVTATTKEVDGCPTQVIVGHLGGYIPATYDQSTIASWQSLLDNLNKVIPSWENAIGYNNVDQSKLKELIDILHKRESLAKEILTAMNNKAWLSDDQQNRIKQDAIDATKAESLSKQLNQE